ncbi:MAG: cytochrome c [Flavobacteriaceae bacterium]|nr:cytochrome c [Bacteroidia bacterium]NNK83093.1 cytochrome c [Flavobacteriaceae bacterium]
MKSAIKYLFLIITFLIVSCGVYEEEEKNKIKLKNKKTEKTIKSTLTTKPSETIDLTNKGIGPIKSITLPAEINQQMVAEGEAVFKRLCSACHRVGKKFIGPAPNGLLKKRTPEWIMNMLLDPEGMAKNDPLAISLLKEYNGSPMVNQNLTENQARAILEYFRTLE